MVDRDDNTDAIATNPLANELRISLVLYGGSSLVIYMNGVAQELLTLVKATSRKAFVHGDEVHDKLRHCYELAARISQHDIDDGYQKLIDETGEEKPSASKIRRALEARDAGRQVVIDVMSGASAGGLNALFLGRALLINGDMQPAMDLLLESGGILELLNDPQSEHTPDDHITKSLLDGDRLYKMAIAAMEQQERDVEMDEAVPLVDSLDCFMALTDLRGIPNPAANPASKTDRPTADTRDLARNEELDHQMTAHLRYGTVGSYGADRNDFLGSSPESSPMLPFLAFVGRATSAHPAAFHPAQLDRLAGLANRRLNARADGKPAFDPDEALWSKLITPTHPAAPLKDRWFSDGGDLDNKPFSHAMDPVEGRRSTTPVDRKIIWVEPDPSPRSADWMDTSAPSLGTVTVGAFNLPRKEGIHGDLNRIDRRNRIARLLKASIREWLPQPSAEGGETASAAAPETEAADRADTEPQVRTDIQRAIDDDLSVPFDDGRIYAVREIWAADVPAAASSPAGKIATATAELADSNQQGPPRKRWHERTPPTTERQLYELERTRYVQDYLVDWCRDCLIEEGVRVDRTAVESAVAAVLGYRREHQSFINHRVVLIDHDLDYRLRRLNFLDQVLTFSQRDEQDSEALNTQRLNRLGTLRSDLNEQYLKLLAIQRRLTRTDDNEQQSRAGAFWLPTPPPVRDKNEPARAELRAFVRHMIEHRKEALAGPMKETADASLRAIAEMGQRDPLAETLLQSWLEFDEADVHLLPRYAELRGELDEIEYLRFSPIDTTTLGEGADNVRRLGGSGVSHFGAFFDDRWRHNDILWGRLHAAELIIKMLMPDPPAANAPGAKEFRTMRDAIINEAQQEVVSQSPDAVQAIGELVGDPSLNETTDPGRVLTALKAIKLDLSLNGDPQRNNDWREILRRLPPALAQIAAAGSFDPWADMSAEDKQQRALYEEQTTVVRRRLRRTASTAETIFNLIVPTTKVSRGVRYWLLPLLAVAGVWGAAGAYGPEKKHLWWIPAGMIVCGALNWIAGKVRHSETFGWLRPPLHLLGFVALIGGALVPLIDPPDSSARAFALTTLYVFASAGLAAVTILGAVTREPGRKIAVAVLSIVSLASLVAAFAINRSAMAFLLGAVVLILASIALYVGLAMVQSAVDAVASKDPNKHADAGEAASPTRRKKAGTNNA